MALLATAVAFVLGASGSWLASRFFWPADLVNFFRPHLLVAGIGLALLLCLWLRTRSAYAVAALTLLAAFIPFASLPARQASAEGFAFRVMAANLFIEGTETARLAAYTAETRPDIIVTEETSPLWQTALLNFAGLPYESSRDLQARNDMKLMSRFPILSETVVTGQDKFPDLVRHPVRFELALPDNTLVLYAIHPDTPREPWQWQQRNEYLALVTAAVVDEPPGTHIVVVGDWNTPSWSPFYRDVLAKTGLNATEFPWWPAATRFSLRFGSIVALGMPIDHLAISSDIGLSAFWTSPKFGSNHVAILSDLTMPQAR